MHYGQTIKDILKKYLPDTPREGKDNSEELRSLRRIQENMRRKREPVVKTKFLEKIEIPPEKVTIHTKQPKQKAKSVENLIIQILNKEKRDNLKMRYLIPDGGKYNPNFNSIYKKIPVAKISNNTNFLMNCSIKEKAVQIEHEKMNKLLSKLSQKNTKTISLQQNILRRTTIDTSNIGNNTIVSEKSLSSGRISPKSKSKGFSFDMYSKRDLGATKTNNENDVLCYVNTTSSPMMRYNHSYDFKKMSKRKAFNGKQVVPPICSYKPNYTCIDKNDNILPFTKQVNKDKRYLVKKIWGNYMCDSEYQTVEFKSHV